MPEVEHSHIAQFAVDRVNLPPAKAREHRDQVNRLRDRLQTKIRIDAVVTSTGKNFFTGPLGPRIDQPSAVANVSTAAPLPFDVPAGNYWTAVLADGLTVLLCRQG